MKYVSVLITVDDIGRAKKFYVEVMKQKIAFDFGQNVAFEGGFAIHLSSHFSGLIDNKPITRGSNAMELYFEFDNVEAFVQGLKAHSIEFIHETREQPWRQKVARFYDPDKNIIEVGESLEYLFYRLSNEGKSVEEIARLTGMPKDFVEKAILERRLQQGE
jgi:predicted enzyme related to lactoylglutathione lyase